MLQHQMGGFKTFWKCVIGRVTDLLRASRISCLRHAQCVSLSIRDNDIIRERLSKCVEGKKKYRNRLLYYM